MTTFVDELPRNHFVYQSFLIVLNCFPFSPSVASEGGFRFFPLNFSSSFFHFIPGGNRVLTLFLLFSFVIFFFFSLSVAAEIGDELPPEMVEAAKLGVSVCV